MSDVIQEVHLIFVEHFGSNMREWPENTMELRKKISSHVSKASTLFKRLGKEERNEEIKQAVDKMLSEVIT